MKRQKVTMGRIVHYGSRKSVHCVPAMITIAWSAQEVQLAVLPDTLEAGEYPVRIINGARYGLDLHWHWPHECPHDKSYFADEPKPEGTAEGKPST